MMKILVCLDGSERSKKILKEASQIATGCQVNDLAVLHVYEPRLDPASPSWGSRTHSLTDADNEYMCKLRGQEKEQRQQLLQEAVKYFEENNLKARAILKEGNPAQTIVSTAAEEGTDMIVIGSRGLGGLKKVFLGSVSSAVIQEADNCTIAVVK
jgi:nucleotide-binding universal stress UspA family protein